MKFINSIASVRPRLNNISFILNKEKKEWKEEGEEE